MHWLYVYQATLLFTGLGLVLFTGKGRKTSGMDLGIDMNCMIRLCLHFSALSRT